MIDLPSSCSLILIFLDLCLSKITVKCAKMSQQFMFWFSEFYSMEVTVTLWIPKYISVEATF